MKKHAAIYLRVSTDEQTVDNQRPDLERIANARTWDRDDVRGAREGSHWARTSRVALGPRHSRGHPHGHSTLKVWRLSLPLLAGLIRIVRIIIAKGARPHVARGIRGCDEVADGRARPRFEKRRDASAGPPVGCRRAPVLALVLAPRVDHKRF